MSIKSKKEFQIFNINISDATYTDTKKVIIEQIKKASPSFICIVNVHVLITAIRDGRLKEILNQSKYNLADGMPIVWYARKILGLRKVERVTGPSMMNKCFNELRCVRHFLYGSTEETLKKIKERAEKEFPRINIVGTFSPPFRNLTNFEKQKIAFMINDISPDIIWVGLGAPKQEYWMMDMMPKIRKGLIIGVGAAFDYFAGNIKRPPMWIRRFGLEWLCRLIQNPRGLWKRYVITNSLFVAYVIREVITGRVSKIKEI